MQNNKQEEGHMSSTRQHGLSTEQKKAGAIHREAGFAGSGSTSGKPLDLAHFIFDAAVSVNRVYAAQLKKEIPAMVREHPDTAQLTLAGFTPPPNPAERPAPRKARTPDKWSFRVDLPMVKENMLNAAGVPIKSRSPEDVAALCADLRQSAQEAFVCVDLNAKNGVIDKRLVTLGVLDASLCHPREIFRGAILNNSAAVVCVHNHPSGDPCPSAEDIRITKQLIEAGRILDIRVLDHVIIGRPDASRPKGFLSLREEGLVSFAE